MGLDLIAFSFTVGSAVALAKAAVALGLVIFVHELGHFLVAKACGVKCEKFYIGFDIYGLKLLKFRWGETEYGIGALPLGGYVKMLGQDDNPARAYEEIQRAKQIETEASAAAGGSHEDAQGHPVTVFDPRSYLAQSVPKRMAIISAGVVMNVIFAFGCAVWAYQLGVPYNPTIVAGLVPGDPAWKAGLQVGDEILQIGKIENPRFSDLRTSVALGDLSAGVGLRIRRGDEILEERLYPTASGELPKIGVIAPLTAELAVRESPVGANTAASRATPPLKSGDRIVAVAPLEPAGQPAATGLGAAATNAEAASDAAPGPDADAADADIAADTAPAPAPDTGPDAGPGPVAAGPAVTIGDYTDLHRALSRFRDRALLVTVERRVESEDPQSTETERVEVEVPRNPIVDVGLVMTMGPIAAVQSQSPASAAGLTAGDTIIRIATAADDEPIYDDATDDPMRLPDAVRAQASQPLSITVRREGQSEPLTMTLTPREVDGYEWPQAIIEAPLSSPELGLAYSVLPRVKSIVAGGPADGAALEPGDQISGFLLRIDENDKSDAAVGLRKELGREAVKFDTAERSWVTLISLLQYCNVESPLRVELLIAGDKERTVVLDPAPVEGWYNPARGFKLRALEAVRTADSFGEAVRLGAAETLDAVLLVYRFLQRLTQQQVPASSLGGPLTILDVASGAASLGFSHLLIFLVMLSANLAVLNFLPIPLLDGGHMVFLILEGVRRKPASEKVLIALHYMGFVFILGLMGFVIYLDITRYLL